jgi:hypothetical protein
VKKIRFTLKSLAIVTLALTCSALAQAQATRTWVSGVGDDVNPCSRTAPCKTFAGAISKTAANGEIDALDPGGFGAVTITKSITIDGTYGAGYGGILASLTNGVTVNAATTDTVVLRNLSIDGAGNGLNGIRYLAAKNLIVEDCVIFGFTNSLINATLTNNGNLYVTNLSGMNSTNNVANSDAGIHLKTTVGFLRAVIDNANLKNNVIGVNAEDNTQTVIRNSVISGNFGTTIGVRMATTTAGGLAHMTLENNMISNSNEALRVTTAGGSVIAYLSNNHFFNNVTASNAAGAVQVLSYNNNKYSNNNIDVSGPYVTQPGQPK